MRIICPSCATAYDIPARAIPADGREVQCSACTHAWYQLPLADPDPVGPDTAPAIAGETAPSAPAPAAMDVPRLREALRGSAPKPGAPVEPAAEDADEAEPDDLPLPPRRRLNPEVLEVLRAEADFEAQARRRAAGAAAAPDKPAAPPKAGPTGPDPVLPDPPWKKQPVNGIQDRLRRLQAAQSAQSVRGSARWEPGEEHDQANEQTAAPVPGTVHPAPPPSAPGPAPAPAGATAEPAQGAPVSVNDPTASNGHLPIPVAAPANPRRAGLPVVSMTGRELALYVQRQEEERRGFRWGFAVSAGLFTLAAALYLSAPALAAAFPASAPLLDLVIAGGKNLRDVFILALQSLLDRLGPPGTV